MGFNVMLEYKLSFKKKENFIMNYQSVIEMKRLQKEQQKFERKQLFSIDKSSIKRIPFVPAAKSVKYIDIDLNVNKEQIKINNKI